MQSRGFKHGAMHRFSSREMLNCELIETSERGLHALRLYLQENLFEESAVNSNFWEERPHGKGKYRGWITQN